MPHTNYEFGPFLLDPSLRRLSRNGDSISLPPKAADLLMLLVTHAGELVKKEEILKQVWPDTFVEEANLSQNIFTLRKVLGHEPSGTKYIETVTRLGYRFVADVRAVDPDGNPQPILKFEETSQPQVVAVLPFVNNTGNGELEYLADGLTENLINNLSRVSKLRVMARTTVFRFKGNDADPRLVVKELGASVVLIGNLFVRNSHVIVGVELVDASNGWQLWGGNFDCQSTDLLRVQEAITRQLLSALNVTLSDEVNRATARYTENAAAYQAYLEGRYHWSQYTKKGIEKAIGHFRRAIEIDPNYALAYAGIVDCYLRLATNYLPPEDDLPLPVGEIPFPVSGSSDRLDELDPKIKLRFEWDWKSAERELRRANELHTDYPSAHQWYAAYLASLALFNEFTRGSSSANVGRVKPIPSPSQLSSVSLSPNEECQIVCTIAREQIEVGNYEAGCLVLRNWWKPGEWPKLNDLSLSSTGDLLFTTGSLAVCLSSTGSLSKGQKHAEALLSGAISIFEHLSAKRRAAECRIELALSYYRQGRLELARGTLLRVLDALAPLDDDLRSLALIRLGVAQRQAGQISDSISRLLEAQRSLQENAPLVSGRYYHELGAALKDLGVAENSSEYLNYASICFQRALYEFVAIGHYRYAAVVENNHGFLLIDLGLLQEAEAHLLLAQRLFNSFADVMRVAQVDDTLARLYMETERFELAARAAERAVARLEESDDDALLAEALTTRGTVYCRLGRRSEARAVLEGAWRIADRCGDLEGAGRALLVLVEQFREELMESELIVVRARMEEVLQHTQLASTRKRLENCLAAIL